MPTTPPETSLSVLPFTVQGGTTLFAIDKENSYRLTYPGVNSALRTMFDFAATTKWAIRVTHVGIYGRTSTAETNEAASEQNLIMLSDLYTGRQVRGVSDYTKRARAGFEAAEIRKMSWYSEGDPDSFPLPVLADIRVGNNTVQCPVENGNAYNIVVKGFVRFTRAVSGCAA